MLSGLVRHVSCLSAYLAMYRESCLLSRAIIHVRLHVMVTLLVRSVEVKVLAKDEPQSQLRNIPELFNVRARQTPSTAKQRGTTDRVEFSLT